MEKRGIEIKQYHKLECVKLFQDSCICLFICQIIGNGKLERILQQKSLLSVHLQTGVPLFVELADQRTEHIGKLFGHDRF